MIYFTLFKYIIMNNFNLNPLELLKRELQLRNYSPRTIKTYLELLALLEKSTGILLKDINTEEFKKFLLKRIKEDCVSTSTVNQTISAFKLLQTDVFSRNWEEIRIKRPRKEKKLPTILSTAEVERIIAVTRNIKHRAILALSYSAGLRKMELLNLKISAIDPERMRIHVRQGKGKKDRDTLLSVKVLELLRFYYKIYKPSQYLFEPQGKKGIPMSEKTMDSIIRKNAERAGIKKNVSFHTLRHCFATHLLEQGVNLRLIQSFLGHTSIKTTSIYLHVANIDPASITSPYDKFNI